LNRPSQKPAIGLALLGCGTVGSGVLKLLRQNREIIERSAGCRLRLARVLDRNRWKLDAAGIAPDAIADSIEDVLAGDVGIVVETLGGTDAARDCVLRCLRSGKSVVTANKDLLAACGRELFSAAEQGGADLFFEAAVCGGVPIIGALKQSLAANRIEGVLGIVNGTTNYVLSRMSSEGVSLDEALRSARELGYAEPDPSADVEGRDAARKLAILASICFRSRVVPDDVYVEGISSVKPEDIGYGSELGYTLKLLAIAARTPGGIQARVHPTFIPDSHPLAAVSGPYNGVYVKGDAVGEVMGYGPGAGQMPTASAVLGDVIEAARNRLQGSTGRTTCTCDGDGHVLPIEALSTKYYMRFTVIDRPGVFAAIAGVFGDHEVSLASVIQKTSGARTAEIVIVTHETSEAGLRGALSVLKGMPVVESVDNVIRVEEA